MIKSCGGEGVRPRGKGSGMGGEGFVWPRRGGQAQDGWGVQSGPEGTSQPGVVGVLQKQGHSSTSRHNVINALQLIGGHQ